MCLNGNDTSRGTESDEVSMDTLEKGNENDQDSSSNVEIEIPLSNNNIYTAVQLQHLLLEKWKQRAKVKVWRIPKTP